MREMRTIAIDVPGVRQPVSLSVCHADLLFEDSWERKEHCIRRMIRSPWQGKVDSMRPSTNYSGYLLPARAGKASPALIDVCLSVCHDVRIKDEFGCYMPA